MQRTWNDPILAGRDPVDGGLPPLAPPLPGELVLKGGGQSLFGFLMELRGTWPILAQLVRRHLVIRYSQTFLGLLWILIQPLMGTLVFSILMGFLVHVRGGGAGYFLVALCGFVPWTAFNQAAERAAMCLTWDERLVAKVYFPRLLLPISAVGSALVDLLVPLALLTLVAGGHLWALLLVPAAIAVLVATALGIGLILSVATLVLRDIRQVHPFLFQMWMVATPVAYPVELLPERWRSAAFINPLCLVVGLFRSAFIDDPMPSPLEIAMGIGSASAVLVLGLQLFRRFEPRMADLL